MFHFPVVSCFGISIRTSVHRQAICPPPRSGTQKQPYQCGTVWGVGCSCVGSRPYRPVPLLRRTRPSGLRRCTSWSSWGQTLGSLLPIPLGLHSHSSALWPPKPGEVDQGHGGPAGSTRFSLALVAHHW